MCSKTAFSPSLPGPITFSSKCRKNAYRLYHHTRDCTLPACKPQLLSIFCVRRESYHHPISTLCMKRKRSLSLSLCFLSLRLQKMCATSLTACRQPTVHRGVADTHSKGTRMLQLTHIADLRHKQTQPLLLRAPRVLTQILKPGIQLYVKEKSQNNLCILT